MKLRIFFAILATLIVYFANNERKEEDAAEKVRFENKMREEKLKVCYQAVDYACFYGKCELSLEEMKEKSCRFLRED